MDNGLALTSVTEAIRSRRSTRNFLDEPVSQAAINEIVEAGRYAPSANNAQTTHFIVITDKAKLAELRSVITSVLANTPEIDGMPPFFINLLQRARQGIVDVSYGAPVLIATANKKGGVNSIADCSCALQNMMLAATALGLGNCWINQYFMLREAPAVREFFEEIGLAEDEDLCGALAVGHTESLECMPLPRTGNTVTYV